MRRWWLLPLGIVIAIAALLAMLRAPSTLPVASGPPPLDDIDPASRERLERVLRDAEREPAR